MHRANRYMLAAQVYHLTYHCHDWRIGYGVSSEWRRCGIPEVDALGAGV